MVNNKEKGFTLIELMIVVAIIGILAAIAIPQFAQFRIKSFNSAAQSDLRNSRTAQEVLFAEYSFYGTSDPDTTEGVAVGTGGIGNLIDGNIPLGAGNNHYIAVSAPNGGPGRAIRLPISNGVQMRFDTDAGESTYIGVCEHLRGNRAYGTDQDSLPLYWVQNNTWVGMPPGINATVPPVLNGQDDFLNAPGGGDTTPNWTLL